MSTIIAICGNNFCTFVSDGRKVGFNPDGSMAGIIDDDTSKIVKLNDRLIIGMTGVFYGSEDIFTPFKEYEDTAVLTMPLALKSILRYMDGKIYPAHRKYLLGGKNNKGQFCQYCIQTGGDGRIAPLVFHQPQYDQFDVKVACNPDTSASKLLQKYIYDTSPWGSHENLIEHMKEFITQMSLIDPTVGGKIFVETAM